MQACDFGICTKSNCPSYLTCTEERVKVRLTLNGTTLTVTNLRNNVTRSIYSPNRKALLDLYFRIAEHLEAKGQLAETSCITA